LSVKIMSTSSTSSSSASFSKWHYFLRDADGGGSANGECVVACGRLAFTFEVTRREELVGCACCLEWLLNRDVREIATYREG
jgi:hypothetical protein